MGKTKEINANKPAIGQGIKLKMIGHKLRSGVNWEGALEQKGMKQMGTKQGPGIVRNVLLLSAASYHTE